MTEFHQSWCSVPYRVVTLQSGYHMSDIHTRIFNMFIN